MFMFKYIRKINYNPEEGLKLSLKITLVELTGERSNEFEADMSRILKAN